MNRGMSIVALLLLMGCSPDRGQEATLYRNSVIDHKMRIHWATFDANEPSDYNMNNCRMAARLLNANSAAFAEADGIQPDPDFGFWCETGLYDSEGYVPIFFASEYPTDVY